jgi:hypothetical protein
VKFAASAVQVPESDCPFIGRAVHVPCQRLPVFCADHVPSRTTSPASLSSVHDPRAALGLRSEVCADHVPRKIWLGPAVAVHEPTRTGEGSWARAQEPKIKPKIKLDTFIPTPGSPVNVPLSYSVGPHRSRVAISILQGSVSIVPPRKGLNPPKLAARSRVCQPARVPKKGPPEPY